MDAIPHVAEDIIAMPVSIPKRKPSPERRIPLWKRAAWFFALYLGGVVSVAIVAYGLKLWIGR